MIRPMRRRTRRGRTIVCSGTYNRHPDNNNMGDNVPWSYPPGRRRETCRKRLQQPTVMACSREGPPTQRPSDEVVEALNKSARGTIDSRTHARTPAMTISSTAPAEICPDALLFLKTCLTVVVLVLVHLIAYIVFDEISYQNFFAIHFLGIITFLLCSTTNGTLPILTQPY